MFRLKDGNMNFDLFINELVDSKEYREIVK